MQEKIPIYAQWAKLCDEHEAARKAYFEAFAIVNGKFAAIGSGSQTINPTPVELAQFEASWNAWQAVKDRMTEFVKKHA